MLRVDARSPNCVLHNKASDGFSTRAYNASPPAREHFVMVLVDHRDERAT